MPAHVGCDGPRFHPRLASDYRSGMDVRHDAPGARRFTGVALTRGRVFETAPRSAVAKLEFSSSQRSKIPGARHPWQVSRPGPAVDRPDGPGWPPTIDSAGL